jgi:hypothetical protein
MSGLNPVTALLRKVLLQLRAELKYVMVHEETLATLC